MSTIEISWPKAIPGFSVLKMKQEIQEKIYEETKDMTNEEIQEHTRQAAERFYQRMAQMRDKQQKDSTAAAEKQTVKP